MTIQVVEEILRRSREDPSFLEQLRTEPDVALHGFDIEYQERAALISGDRERLVQLGVDPLLSDLAEASHPKRQHEL